MFAKLWNDESGIVAMEYLLLATIVGLGLIVGLGALEGALNAELTEVANAILGLSQAYTIETQSNCKAIKIGSSAVDTNSTIGFSSSTFGIVVQNVDVLVCTP